LSRLTGWPPPKRLTASSWSRARVRRGRAKPPSAVVSIHVPGQQAGRRRRAPRIRRRIWAERKWPRWSAKVSPPCPPESSPACIPFHTRSRSGMAGKCQAGSRAAKVQDEARHRWRGTVRLRGEVTMPPQLSPTHLRQAELPKVVADSGLAIMLCSGTGMRRCAGFPRSRRAPRSMRCWPNRAAGSDPDPRRHVRSIPKAAHRRGCDEPARSPIRTLRLTPMKSPRHPRARPAQNKMHFNTVEQVIPAVGKLDLLREPGNADVARSRAEYARDRGRAHRKGQGSPSLNITSPTGDPTTYRGSASGSYDMARVATRPLRAGQRCTAGKSPKAK